MEEPVQNQKYRLDEAKSDPQTGGTGEDQTLPNKRTERKTKGPVLGSYVGRVVRRGPKDH